MQFTVGHIQSVHDALKRHDQYMESAPREVLRAVAVLCGDDEMTHVLCSKETGGDATTWRVVALLSSRTVLRVTASAAVSGWDFDSSADRAGVPAELTASLTPIRSVTSLDLVATSGLWSLDANANSPWDAEAEWRVTFTDGAEMRLPGIKRPNRNERAEAESMAAEIRSALVGSFDPA